MMIESDRHSQKDKFWQRDRLLNKQSLLISDNPGSEVSFDFF